MKNKEMKYRKKYQWRNNNEKKKIYNKINEIK